MAMELKHEFPDGAKVYDMFPSKKPDHPVPAYDRNNLQVGQEIWLHGYGDDHYIIEKLEHRENWTMYSLIHMKDFSRRNIQSWAMKHVLEKTDERIQFYIMDHVHTAFDLMQFIKKADEVQANDISEAEAANAERQRLIEIGRPIAERHLKGAKAFIIAELREDESDTMTDYFSSRTGDMVVLGTSNHTRNLFPELRKFAEIIEETAHLAEPNPEFEHRENYSMGHGTYLKQGWYNSNGWMIYKTSYLQWDNDEILMSLAKHNVLDQEAELKESKSRLEQLHAPKPEAGRCEIGEYKGHPTISVPLGVKSKLTMGVSKVQAILDNLDELKAFAEANSMKDPF